LDALIDVSLSDVAKQNIEVWNNYHNRNY
jgi:hypothetical protein